MLLSVLMFFRFPTLDSLTPSVKAFLGGIMCLKMSLLAGTAFLGKKRSTGCGTTVLWLVLLLTRAVEKVLSTGSLSTEWHCCYSTMEVMQGGELLSTCQHCLGTMGKMKNTDLHSTAWHHHTKAMEEAQSRNPHSAHQHRHPIGGGTNSITAMLGQWRKCS